MPEEGGKRGELWPTPGTELRRMSSGDLKMIFASDILAQGHGEQWCNGECGWTDGQCLHLSFYSSDDYVKDETTNLMMAAVTAKTCREYDGFVCKVNYEV